MSLYGHVDDFNSTNQPQQIFLWQHHFTFSSFLGCNLHFFCPKTFWHLHEDELTHNWTIKVHRKAKKINGGFFQIKSHFSLSVQFLSVTFLKKKKYFDSISVKIFQKIEENIEEEIRFFRVAMFIFKTAAFRSVGWLTISFFYYFFFFNFYFYDVIHKKAFTYKK